MEIDFFVLLGALVLFLVIGYFAGKKLADLEWQQIKLPLFREDAIKKSRAVLGGQFSEQIAPYLPNFPFLPTEVRFLGKPIDFVVFKGLDAKSVEEIIFVEVKSGKSSLSTPEKSLKKAVEEKKVRWLEYRVPEKITGA